MDKTTMFNNVVSENVYHDVQKKTLDSLSKILMKSYGPMGSTTCIKKPNIATQYSKDGHTILSNVHFHGVIEDSIKDDIETITRAVVTSVGDGTTSAVLLSNFIFNDLIKLTEEGKYKPSEILETLNSIVDAIKDTIKVNYTKECTIDDIYDICMISTNGNKDISDRIYQIYKAYGTSVFIDVSASLSGETYLKEYDGMMINTGMTDSFYANRDNNTCELYDPEVYFFEHPIDTMEMAVLFDAIISNNIVAPLNDAQENNSNPAFVPTVIVCPKISQDLSSYMDSISNMMMQVPPSSRPPLLVISNTHQIDEIMDLAVLCGAKNIRKYIDSNIYKKDVASGNAPTTNNIKEFAGKCELVVSDTNKTKFSNPQYMRDGNGNYSNIYNNLMDFLQKTLENAKTEGEDANVIGTLKRRINSLKSNMVEIFVGGISPSDRDATRDLVEDAVLNCRSSCDFGVGWGANFNGLLAAHDIFDSEDGNENLYNTISASIYDAYYACVMALYNNAVPADKIKYYVNESIDEMMPLNLRNMEYDGKVKSSANGDIVILDAVCKIIGLMLTSNQCIVPTVALNTYETFDY